MGFTAVAMQVFGFFSLMLLVGWLINTELQSVVNVGTPGAVAINGRDECRKNSVTVGRIYLNVSFSFSNFTDVYTSPVDDLLGLWFFFSFLLFHCTYFFFGTLQFVSATFPLVWLMSFRKGVSRPQRPRLAPQEPVDILELVFPAKFFDVSGTRYRNGWRFKIRCRITDETFLESVRKKNLDSALQVLLERYGFVAQAAGGLIIDVILLAVAIYNHYYLCGRKGFGLHLACVHFIRSRYPEWCETDFTLGNLAPVHRQAIQAVLEFHRQEAVEWTHPNWRHEFDDENLEAQGFEDSAFWRSLVKIVSVVIAVFGVTQHSDLSYTDVSRLVSAAMRGGTVLTVTTATEFISEVRNIFTTLQSFWSSGWDFSTFFDCNGEIRELNQTLTFLENEHNELANKLDCDLTFQLQEMLVRLEKCRARIGVLYTTHPARHADIRVVDQRAKVAFDAVTLTLVNSSRGRVQPFAITLVGGSSIGKSSITDWFLHQFAADSPFITEQNRLEQKDAPSPLDMGLVYRSTLGNATTDQYFTGLFNSSWAGVFDDMCVTATKISSEAYAAFNSGIIKILNIFPYRTEQASLENKGKIFCNFQLVILTSNVLDLCAYQTANCPAAILRRAGYFVQPTVKPEFIIRGTGQLDAGLVHAYSEAHSVHNGQPLPLHTFDVWTYRVGVDGKPFREDVLTGAEIDELMAFLRVSWTTHAKNEVGRMKRGTNVQYCANCRTIGVDPVSKLCAACRNRVRTVLEDVRNTMSIFGILSQIRDTYTHTILVPFVEEYVKVQLFCTHPVLFIGAVVLESFFYVRIHHATWRDRLVPIIWHMVCTTIAVSLPRGYFLAVLLHSLWNSLILQCMAQSGLIMAALGVWLYVDAGLPYIGTCLIGCIFPMCCEKGVKFTDGIIFFFRMLFFTALTTQTSEENRAMIMATQLVPGYMGMMSILSPINCLFECYTFTMRAFEYLDFRSLFVWFDVLVDIVMLVALYKLVQFFRHPHFETYLRQRFRSFLTSRFNFIRARLSQWRNRKMLKALALILVALSSVTVIWYASQLFAKAQPQGASLSQPVAMGKNFWSFGWGASSLAASPGTQPEPFEQAVQTNVVKMRIGTVNLKGFCVEENFFLCTKHELDSAIGSDTRTNFSVTYAPGRAFRPATGVLCLENIARHPTKDLALVQLPNTSSLKRLTQYFLTADDADATTQLGEGKIAGLSDHLIVRSFPLAHRKTISITYSEGSKLTQVYQLKSYIGDTLYETAKGDCGSIMYSAHRGKCALLGIHIAGNRGLTGVLPVSADDVAILLQSVRRHRQVLEDDSQLFDDFKAQGKTLEPGCHAKCPLNFMGDDPGTEPIVLGNLGSQPQRANRNTNFISSRFTAWWSNKRISHLCRHCVDFNVPLAVIGKFTPPILTGFGWIPKFRFCDVATDVKECLETTRVRELSRKVLHHYLSNREFVDRLRKVRPLNEDQTVNGMDGAKFVKSMNMRSSAGFPHKGIKKDLFVLRSSDPNKYDLPQEIRERIERLEQRARSGIRPGVVFTATYKDEPVSKEKTELTEQLAIDLSQTTRETIRSTKYGKIRVFQAVNVETTFVVRKYYLTLVSLMQEYGLHTGIAVGTNCYSKEWSKLRDHLIPDGWERRFICGDFSSYDQRMGQEWLLAAWSVLREMLKLTDYYEELSTTEKLEYETMLDSLAHDISNPTTLFFGDVLRLNGTNASGHPLTVIINGVANLMYMIYAFESVYPTEDFFEKVRVMTYGDDNILNVHNSCPLFTQPAATHALAQINVMYTASDKGVVASDYVSEPSFLKRTWRDTEYELDGQTHSVVTCPIEFATIQKMLSMETKKSPDDQNNRIIQVLGSMLFEFIQYGRSPYEQAVNLCEQFCCEHNLVVNKDAVFPRGWPSYDEYMRAWITDDIYTVCDPDDAETLEC